MTTELLICVMPEEWCRFQHSKYSSSYLREALAFELYSTGQRLKFIYSQEKYLKQNKTIKKKSLTLSFQVAVMCFAKHTTSVLELYVLMSPSYNACIHVIFGKVRIRLRLFTLLYAVFIFILNLACWVGAHSKVQCGVAAAGEDTPPS